MSRAAAKRMRQIPVAIISIALLFVAGGVIPNAGLSAPPERQSDHVSKTIKRYCGDCHGNGSSEGERNFDAFSLPIRTVAQLITADEIIDQLTLKLMPPPEAEQPDTNSRIELLQSLRNAIKSARDSFDSTGGRTVIRRLSNREYENTIATLFDRRIDTLGLTANFPKDQTEHNIDTIGNSLVTSGFLLDEYFHAASRLVDLRLGKEAMDPVEWHFQGNFKQYEELTGSHKSVFNNRFLCLYEQPNTDTRQGGYGHIEEFLQGVPVSGLYNIEIKAQAMHRDTHYDPKIFKIDFSEPFRIGVVPGDVTKGHIHYPQSVEPVLATAIVPDNSPELIPFTVWLEKGQTPRFIFPNGPYESRASVIETNRRYKSEFKNPKEGVSRATLLREGALPHIRISEITIRGPLAEEGGSREELAVFGNSGFQAQLASKQLLGFAKKAFRRPLTDADKSQIKSFYKDRLESGMNEKDAALATVKMILCSPSFLYLSEITEEDDATLKSHDLAARIAYAIWACPPDERLTELASQNDLRTTEILKSEIERMLQDRKSEALVSGFLDSWLNLREIGNQPPPRKSAISFYAENLPFSMKRETQLFFQDLLEQNGSILNLIDANYTFIDKKLAKHYQLPIHDTMRLQDGFRRVTLENTHRRGGLLGMASVLTVSANGVDTSPVTRGAWILEYLLGTPSPPPPDEVPAIESDVSQAKSIREKLAIHREDQACNVCHRNIDPLGFPLENFDPVGRWRQKYPAQKKGQQRLAIDPTGELSSGEKYENFAEFKLALKQSRADDLTRSLVESLLAYSSGRSMERLDQYEINDIVERVKEDGYGLRTAVFEVLTSEIFRSR